MIKVHFLHPKSRFFGTKINVFFHLSYVILNFITKIRFHEKRNGDLG